MASISALFLIIVAFWIAALVFWVMKIIEVARIPEAQYRAAGTDKTLWILVVVLAQLIGALIWQFAKRSDVLAVAGRVPNPPPGWYADGTGGMRWWDGLMWSEQRHVPPPPS